MLSAATLGKKQYALLGLLLCQTKPDIANELISSYIPQQEPLEKDLEKIESFFKHFCHLRNIHPKDCIGPVYKSSKVELRRRFVASILHIYAPHLYDQPVDFLIMGKTELSKRLSHVLQMKKCNVATLVREVILWEKQYEEFASSVADITLKLMNHGSTDGK